MKQDLEKINQEENLTNLFKRLLAAYSGVRFIIYGDIHGCFEEFLSLRDLIDVEPNDIEVSVGDFITKGPKSLEVLRFFKENKIYSVRGNHEDKIIRYYYHEKSGKKNPIKLDDVDKNFYLSLKDDDFDYLLSLPIFIKFEKLTIVHAGILPDTNLAKLDKKAASKVMRVRYVDEDGKFVALDRVDKRVHFYWSELYDGRYGYVVYGHQPFLRPRIDRFSFGIDTAAVYGNRLTALIFEDGSYYFKSVKSKTYAKSKRLEITD